MDRTESKVEEVMELINNPLFEQGCKYWFSNLTAYEVHQLIKSRTDILEVERLLKNPYKV